MGVLYRGLSLSLSLFPSLALGQILHTSKIFCGLYLAEP